MRRAEEAPGKPTAALAGVGLFAILGLALVAAMGVKRGQVSRGTGAGGGSWSDPGGHDLPDGAAAFLNKLAASLGVALVVTSGIRSPDAQAKAMQAKEDRLKAGSTAASDDIGKLYADKDQIAALRANPYSAWADLIAAYAANGRPISNHLNPPARAVDLAWPNGIAHSSAVAAATSLGAHSIEESDHWHIDLPKETEPNA